MEPCIFAGNVVGLPLAATMGRIARFEDIFRPILFLTGPGASCITGRVIHGKGGRGTP